METPVGVSPEKISQFVLETEAAKRATADPLPGPLTEAFGPQDIVVGKFKIRPLVAYDWAIMKHLNSPIYRQMLEVMQSGDAAQDVPADPEENWELIYLLTRSCEEADVVFKKGRDAFREAAKKEFGFKFNIYQISQLSEACNQQILNHMKTMTRFAPEEKGDGEVKNFPVAGAN